MTPSWLWYGVRRPCWLRSSISLVNSTQQDGVEVRRVAGRLQTRNTRPIWTHYRPERHQYYTRYSREQFCDCVWFDCTSWCQWKCTALCFRVHERHAPVSWNAPEKHRNVFYFREGLPGDCTDTHNRVPTC